MERREIFYGFFFFVFWGFLFFYFFLAIESFGSHENPEGNVLSSRGRFCIKVKNPERCCHIVDISVNIKFQQAD